MSDGGDFQVRDDGSSRAIIQVAGLGSVTINRTHEGLIVDVFDLAGDECAASLALLESDFDNH